MVAGVDRFGNPIDPEVGYARGRILASSEDEALRRERGMALIRARYKAFGREGLYDLTGLSGGFPVEPEHLGALETYIAVSYTHLTLPTTERV